MKKLFLATMITAAFTMATTAQASVTSDISNSNAGLELGASAKHNGWFHSDPGGLPGIKVPAAKDKITSFKSLKKITRKTQFLRVFGGIDKNDVVVLKMSNMPSWVPGFHNKLGNFAFKQIADQEVYFGEWTANGKSELKDRVVYYAGNNKTTNMPSTGTAVYAVKGINHNSNMNQEILSGNLIANFAQKKLNGKLTKSNMTLEIKANIKGAGFNGDAFANRLPGKTKGQFFGSNAASLAGIATFASDHSKDTAFGGLKK